MLASPFISALSNIHALPYTKLFPQILAEPHTFAKGPIKAVGSTQAVSATRPPPLM